MKHKKTYRQNYFGFNKVHAIDPATTKCELCGQPYKNIHHIRHVANGGSNKQTNLIALCISCHTEVHRKTFTRDWELYTISMKRVLAKRRMIYAHKI